MSVLCIVRFGDQTSIVKWVFDLHCVTRRPLGFGYGCAATQKTRYSTSMIFLRQFRESELTIFLVQNIVVCLMDTEGRSAYCAWQENLICMERWLCLECVWPGLDTPHISNSYNWMLSSLALLISSVFLYQTKNSIDRYLKEANLRHFKLLIGSFWAAPQPRG